MMGVRYIPLILKCISNRNDLTNSLENILMNDFEIGYDKENNAHRESLDEIVEKIMKLGP